MIYLIESSNYYKIGYAKDVQQRLKAYNTHNPDYKLIDTVEGDKNDEQILHTLCQEFNNKLEWFTKCDDVINIWKDYKKVKPIITKLNSTLKSQKTEIEKLKEEIHKVNLFLDELQLDHYNEMLFINNLKNIRYNCSEKELIDYIDSFLQNKN